MVVASIIIIECFYLSLLSLVKCFIMADGQGHVTYSSSSLLWYFWSPGWWYSLSGKQWQIFKPFPLELCKFVCHSIKMLSIKDHAVFHICLQSGPHNSYCIYGFLQALLWLLFLQCLAVSSTSPTYLLGLLHPSHGLQVCVHGQGKCDCLMAVTSVTKMCRVTGLFF